MSQEDNIGVATTSEQEPLAVFPSEADNICVNLSERDADHVLELLQNPPPPNEVARRAAERFKQIYG